jgi:hypothetical protein
MAARITPAMDKLSTNERAISAAVVMPAAIIVLALAFLQYNWTNQITDATSQRLADSLQMSMVNWHLDFFRQFSQICLALGVDPDGRAPADIQQLARAFTDWEKGAPYPELVSGLYLVPADPKSDAPTLGFDPASWRLVPKELPPDIRSLHEKLEGLHFEYPIEGAGPASVAQPESSHASRKLPAEDSYPGGLLRGWSFDPRLPGLVHPLFGADSAPETGKRVPIAWIVLSLNGNLIRTSMLPDLTQRYFQGTDGLDFQVAVVSRSNTDDVIYTSDSDFGSRPVLDADGEMNLFGRTEGKEGSPVRVFRKTSVNKGPAGSVGISWFPLITNSPVDTDWQLIVRHRRGGPLGAFVTELRRRNLMISFGVLFLLVVNIAMVIITSYRAQRLANLQMSFVTAVSHELRTPLTVITSAADNIEHGVVEGRQQLSHYGAVIGRANLAICRDARRSSPLQFLQARGT